MASLNPTPAGDQIMSLRTNADTPASTLEELCKKIKKEMIPPRRQANNNSGPQKNKQPKQEETLRQFIPQNVLKRLISRDAVQNVLQHSKVHLETQLDSPIPDLAEWFSSKAPKVFAILAKAFEQVDSDKIAGKARVTLRRIEHLYKVGIHDDMLPVEFIWLDDDQTEYEIKSWKDGAGYDEKVREAFTCGGGGPWGSTARNAIFWFCESWQWLIVPPVFVEDEFEYTFSKNARLPFTRVKGTITNPNSLYSYVQERSIHVDHLPRKPEIALDNQGNPRVAIKQLQQQGDDLESVAQGEADVLNLMRNLKHKHLIEAIAYYRQGERHYFMFPWAEEGNLWDVWKKKTPSTDRTFIIWVFTQLIGLTGAIEKLHHGDGKLMLNSNCRHGDLKPANILCFKTKDGQEDNPTLVITDVGLAKAHNDATELRNKTVRSVTTKRYEPPELGVDPDTPKSRRFDIWSLGCIYLEFVIWLLYGTMKLEEFSHLVGPFYNTETVQAGSQQHLSTTLKKTTVKVAQVHEEVEEWISYMVKKDWRCSEGTAVRRLIDLIRTRMLKIPLLDPNVVSGRPSPKKQQTAGPHSLVPNTVESRADQGDSASDIPRWTITEHVEGEPDSSLDTNQTMAAALEDGLSRDPRFRAYAPEIREELEEILAGLKFEKNEGREESEDEEREPIKVIEDRPPEDASIPPGPSTIGKIETDGSRGGLESTERHNEYVSDTGPICRMFRKLKRLLI